MDTKDVDEDVFDGWQRMPLQPAVDGSLVLRLSQFLGLRHAPNQRADKADVMLGVGLA